MVGGAELHQTLVAGGTWDLLLARFDRSTAAPPPSRPADPLPAGSSGADGEGPAHGVAWAGLRLGWLPSTAALI